MVEPKVPRNNSILLSFNEVMINLNNFNGVISPDEFHQRLPDPFGSSLNQQDSMEFGRILLQSIEEEI